MRITIGVIMLLTPFFALGWWMCRTDGWRTAALIYGLTTVFVAWVLLSVHLVFGRL